MREHRNGFHKPVIGPLLTLVECEDATHRNYLEQNVPRWAWGTYITQDDRDRDKLSQAFKDFGLNVMNITNVSYREPDVSHLRSWGVTHRLDQCFQAEPIVKQALCDAGNVDRAFVMDPKVTDAQVEKLLKETNDVPKALTPRTVFNKTKSRYDPSAITLSTYGVKNSQLFTANANASQRAEVVEEIKGLKDDVATVKRSIEAANQEWNALQGQYPRGDEETGFHLEHAQGRGPEEERAAAAGAGGGEGAGSVPKERGRGGTRGDRRREAQGEHGEAGRKPSPR